MSEPGGAALRARRSRAFSGGDLCGLSAAGALHQQSAWMGRYHSPYEALPWELRQRQLTQVSRAKLRERVAVGHTFAQIGRWQGRRTRYRGLRKDLFDLRRSAMVHNWHVITRLPETSGEEAA